MAAAETAEAAAQRLRSSRSKRRGENEGKGICDDRAYPPTPRQCEMDETVGGGGKVKKRKRGYGKDPLAEPRPSMTIERSPQRLMWHTRGTRVSACGIPCCFCAWPAPGFAARTPASGGPPFRGGEDASASDEEDEADSPGRRATRRLASSRSSQLGSSCGGRTGPTCTTVNRVQGAGARACVRTKMTIITATTTICVTCLPASLGHPFP